MPRSFEIDAAIASSRSFAHGRQEPVARPYPARLRPSPSDERWAPGAGRLSRRSLATSAAGEDLCRRLCSSFCAPGATAHHLPVTMWQVSLCCVRPTVRVVATHRCAPLPATRDRPGRLHGRCAADRRRRRMRTDSARQSTATTLDAPRQRPQGPLCLRWWRRGGGSTLQQEDIIISFTACRRLTSAVRPAPIDYRDVRLRSQPREKASTTSCAIVLRASSRRTPPAGHHATGVVMLRAADGDSSRYAPMRAAPRRGRTASNPARCSPRWAPRLLF